MSRAGRTAGMTSLLTGTDPSARTVAPMSDDTNDHQTPDGSTDVSAEERRRTEELGDGSQSGDATQDPQQDSDVDSGGEPADPR